MQTHLNFVSRTGRRNAFSTIAKYRTNLVVQLLQLTRRPSPILFSIDLHK